MKLILKKVILKLKIKPTQKLLIKQFRYKIKIQKEQKFEIYFKKIIFKVS